MLYALDTTSAQKVTALPQRTGTCPGCRASLIPKCGSLISWHWSHRADRDCDSWFEPESRWHLGWKELFPASQVEVVIGRHRADIALPSGVIELQHSPIAPEVIRERECFYQNMAWVFDARAFKDRLSIRHMGLPRVDFRGREYTHTFRWRHARISQATCCCPVLWDMGDGWLFYAMWIANRRECTGGFGRWLSVPDFLAALLNPAPITVSLAAAA